MQFNTHTLTFNHLSFPSRDVTATAAFFERYLDWPGNFHIGFELPSLDALRELYERFQHADVEFASGLIAHERGSRFFCRVPGGVLVELNTREDAAAPYRAGFGRA